MSLDTVIKIGKMYREAPDAWKHHDQINKTLSDIKALSKNKDNNKNLITTTIYEIPVIDRGDKMFFDLENKINLTNEDTSNTIDEYRLDNLYYLNFKTSKKDTSKKYLFGDIVYAGYKNNKDAFIELGNYRMTGAWEDKKNKDGILTKKSSFWVCEDAAASMENENIRKFRNEFRENIDKIESILKSHQSVVLLFNFDGKRWIDLEGIVEAIDYVLADGLVVQHTDGKHVVLDKYLYKTLGGTPSGFLKENEYKSRLFKRDDIISLLYANQACENPIIRISKSIGVLVLPHSENKELITPETLINFYNRQSNSLEKELNEEESKEEQLLELAEDINESSNTDIDPCFGNLIDNNFENKIKFDLIFTSIPSSPSGVFHDLIEIPNVEKSFLIKIHNEIRKERLALKENFRASFPNAKHDLNIGIKHSFLKILGDLTKDKKMAQNHIIKMLPKIYTDSYYSDPMLLPAFIEKIEYGIRNDTLPFNIIKYDFYFLMNIQKLNTLMNITKTKSYELGRYLGIMAKPFAGWRDDCPIKSFEKAYVGNLSRRIFRIADLVKFAREMNEKLNMHSSQKNQYITQKKAFLDIINLMNDFGNEKYNMHNCSLGFFESYYESLKSETLNEQNNIEVENN